MQKISVKNFQGPILDLNFFSPSPLFFPRKKGVNPTENHINSIFRGKIRWFFSGLPFSDLQNFKTPLLYQAPAYRCFWMVPYHEGKQWISSRQTFTFAFTSKIQPRQSCIQFFSKVQLYFRVHYVSIHGNYL